MQEERFLSPAINSEEQQLIQAIRPELNSICSNPIRATIIHSLVKAKNLNYSLSVEELSRALGKRHSLIIHHLEKLNNCNLVAVVKSKMHGSKEKRCIWGLNLKYQNLISLTYNHILKHFFTQSQLDRMCTVYNNVRVNPKNSKGIKTF